MGTLTYYVVCHGNKKSGKNRRRQRTKMEEQQYTGILIRWKLSKVNSQSQESERTLEIMERNIE